MTLYSLAKLHEQIDSDKTNNTMNHQVGENRLRLGSTRLWCLMSIIMMQMHRDPTDHQYWHLTQSLCLLAAAWKQSFWKVCACSLYCHLCFTSVFYHILNDLFVGRRKETNESDVLKCNYYHWNSNYKPYITTVVINHYQLGIT